MKPVAVMTLCAGLLAAGCASDTGGRMIVTGTGPDDLLKLRSGPSLEYKIIMGLPDGTELLRRDCVTELNQRWCRVSLVESPDVTGYVSADYLTQL
ncbi:SH3 domain-containing protein [Ponticoccus alexandrii]|uniref:SH3 domain-containing protein n=1 Tax=Ponticoccus alexandrii TaxID=1943633 RepID=A0ABX7F7E9_9RHOB|nr:SH3 domain-containing protein [Ponticoccus alexandrii]ETA51392.1 peptide-binding protein [Rhodobacteraceae bacterium PD-2]QRF66453.1 SH3 domain-containing protein [Ponticoccus alexandrii]